MYFNLILFCAKSAIKLKFHSKFGLILKDSEKNSLCVNVAIKKSSYKIETTTEWFSLSYAANNFYNKYKSIHIFYRSSYKL